MYQVNITTKDRCNVCLRYLDIWEPIRINEHGDIICLNCEEKEHENQIKEKIAQAVDAAWEKNRY